MPRCKIGGMKTNTAYKTDLPPPGSLARRTYDLFISTSMFGYLPLYIGRDRIWFWRLFKKSGGDMSTIRLKDAELLHRSLQMAAAEVSRRACDLADLASEMGGIVHAIRERAWSREMERARLAFRAKQFAGRPLPEDPDIDEVGFVAQ